MEALAQLVTLIANLITSLFESLVGFISGVLTGGSPISLLIVVTLIVVVLGKLRGDDRY